ncbi:hypothetical protein Poli38472_007424 [Pythium oligandrum]|uniref:Uncharacterized protein n=1 Tax=Pythium oligandrum TaxID=41045 RepID=A0A8K1CS58_PYTOL|nr:hypothetical protein Poli38472_007424 [Pythium oligandrum]|eukprot:TMW67752.1 hypothetical protein Poli38472_007424 [Pythium oligandrum]
MSKTHTRTERAMVGELSEDGEVLTALGEGEQSFERVMDDVAQRADTVQRMMHKTLQLVRQIQQAEEAARHLNDDDANAKGASQQLRELKITVEALHKEKSMLLSHLQEQVRAHKELMAATDEQNQELKKAQIALGLKQDELKTIREDFQIRLSDLQRVNETSQQNVTMWRDKYQSGLKIIGENEQKVLELEKRVAAQAEEIVKHDVVLRAKNQEVEKQRERLKESESLRLRAEAAQRDATAAAAAANSKAEAAEARIRKGDAAVAALSGKERMELEAKIKNQEATIRDLQQKLRELGATRSKYEDDNTELTRLVRELKARAEEAMKNQKIVTVVEPASPPPVAPLRRSTSFAISFRQQRPRRSSQRRGSLQDRRASGPDAVDDDLSTSSGEEDADVDPDTERDELELSETVQQVVTSVFRPRVSAMPQSDESISHTIAQYEEDPLGSPLSMSRVSSSFAALEEPMAALMASLPSTSTVPQTEVERVRQEYEDEIARLKKQYVASLLEYKKLVIEQYERRQAETQEHHRIEVENLIMLVQDKFRKELERRGEKMLQAKESLKLLYRAMKLDGGMLTGGRLGGLSASRRSSIAEEESDIEDERVEEPVPLKSLLRAAVFAMSTSRKRNEHANVQITEIYENIKGKNAKGRSRAPRIKVAVKATSPPRSPEPVAPPARKEEPAPAQETDWASFLKSMRARRDEETQRAANGSSVATVHVACQVEENDFLIFNLKGLRASHVTPENLDGFILPTAGYGNGSDDGTPRRGGGRNVLYLTEGVVFSDEIVHELRTLLPFLPPGSYYLSATLRHQLMTELFRFYSDLGSTGCYQSASETSMEQPRRGRDTSEDDVVVMLGSPRDTPFLRRKATESLERRKIQRRRDHLTSGGVAVLQQLPRASFAVTSASPKLIDGALRPASHVTDSRGSSYPLRSLNQS